MDSADQPPATEEQFPEQFACICPAPPVAVEGCPAHPARYAAQQFATQLPPVGEGGSNVGAGEASTHGERRAPALDGLLSHVVGHPVEAYIATDDARPAVDPGRAGEDDGFDRDAIRARLHRAFDELHGLCDGSRKWTMRVPADETRDSDLVISASLEDLDELLDDWAEVTRQRDRWHLTHDGVLVALVAANRHADTLRGLLTPPGHPDTDAVRARCRPGVPITVEGARQVYADAYDLATVVDRLRVEARAKAVDGGEWGWAYGFIRPADGQFVHHGDESQARALANVVHLPIHRQRVWRGEVEVVGDDGSGT